MRTVDADNAELSERELALYRAFLTGSRTRSGATLSHRSFTGAAADLGLGVADLDKELTRLLEMGLLRPVTDGVGTRRAPDAGSDDGDSFSAVSPLLAEASVLGVIELELSARRAELEMRRAAIRQAIPDWAETLRQAPSPGLVDVVSDPGETANVMMHYADRCQREVLSMAPGRGPGQTGRIDPRTRTANVYALNRGVRIRSIYQHVALHDRLSASYLRELTDLGAAVRITHSVPGRALVIDREVALLRLPSADPDLPSAVAIVHEPNVVSWVVATFEQLWAEALPIQEVSGRDAAVEVELDQTRVAILRLMADGEKDEAISRRLSISVRTCRRHIADYMAAVGAMSRFQAGVIAARAGHLGQSGR